LYARALNELSAGKFDAFHATKAQLRDYVLYGYLEYAELRNRLRSVNPEQVREFRTRYADSPLASRLNDTWLLELWRRGEWQHYLDFYEGSDNVQLQCLYLRALEHHDEHERAMAGVAALWRVGTSQPKDCDPLFATWIAEDHLTFGLVWERLTLALQAREWQLARYLISLLDTPQRQQAELFYQVYREPSLVTQTRRFAHDNAQTRDIIAIGIRRLATSDPPAAAVAWQGYRQRFEFAADTRRVVAQDLAIGFARRGVIDTSVDLAPSPDGRELLVFEAQLSAAIATQQWPTIVDLINRLDPAERAKPRWQYWLGRAQRQLPDAAESVVQADPWPELATERHYYGFLAAQRLGVTPRLNEQPSAPSASATAALQALPAMQRISELYALDDLTDARREWNYLAIRLTTEQLAAAALQLAQMGWTYQSIMAANQADVRDDLALRFPAPYLQLFRTASHATSVPLSFLYGIARQESAFAAAARSPAGALGLMQLMPATAAATARSNGGTPPGGDELFRADVSVQIGSQHLAELLERYDGNRVLVAAAYNAGKYRVDRWLHDRPASPVDVWIETIPFFETRNYVMNVLAFSYVYGQRLQRPTPFLTARES
jgi:peptidoglycan lytic transglycosylase